MVNPFALLNVATDSDDNTIKQAYLAKVQLYPPERCPEAFELIRSAYEKISTHQKRLNYLLFNPDPIEAPSLIISLLQKNEQPSHFSKSAFQLALAESVDTLAKQKSHEE